MAELAGLVIEGAILSLHVAAHVAAHIAERSKMKERDEEIEQERNREREMEQQSLETPRDRKMSTIQHFSHQHPLHQVYMSTAFQCGSCEVSSSGWAYTCKEPGCSYSLHAVCSGAPVTLQPSMAAAVGQAPHHAPSEAVTTFAHQKDHPLKDVYSNLEFQCHHCLTNGKGRRYKCTDCDVDLHSVCTKHPTRLSTFLHPQHELELVNKKRFKSCQICGHSPKSGKYQRVYGCKECKFWVHPTCSQLAQYLLHDLHPMTDPPHMLQLKLVESDKKTQCDAKCGSNCTTGWQYVCTLCSVSFHIKCIISHSVQSTSAQGKSDIGLSIMIGAFSELADAAGFGIFDVATVLV